MCVVCCLDGDGTVIQYSIFSFLLLPVGATPSVAGACIAVAGVCWRSGRRGARVGGAEGRRVACSSGRGANSPPPDRERGGL